MAASRSDQLTARPHNQQNYTVSPKNSRLHFFGITPAKNRRILVIAGIQQPQKICQKMVVCCGAGLH